MNKTILKISGLVIILLVVFATGRYCTPEKVITKTETVEVIKEVKVVETVTVQQNKRQTKTVITEYPDGKKVTEIYEVNEDVIFIENNSNSTVDSNTSTNTTTIVKTDKPNWNLYGVAGYQDNRFNYGINVNRRILGPVFIGVTGKNNKDLSIGIGIEF